MELHEGEAREKQVFGLMRELRLLEKFVPWELEVAVGLPCMDLL